MAVVVLLCRVSGDVLVAVSQAANFADAHDKQMWACFSQLVGIASLSAKAQQYITIPLSLGGIGLSSANRS